MGSAVDKRRKIYSLDSVAAVSKGIAADIFLEARWGMDVACSVARCRCRRRNAGQADFERGTPLCEVHQWGRTLEFPISPHQSHHTNGVGPSNSNSCSAGMMWPSVPT